MNDIFSFNINGMTWTIEQEEPEKMKLETGCMLGLAVFMEKKILLNKEQDLKQLRSTLAHELTHAFLYETQIVSQEEDFRYTEEMVCEFVGKYGAKIQKVTKAYFKTLKEGE